MKKFKLLMSLATMCLAIAVLCFGVFSATQVNYNIGGTISYEVTDAFVKVNTKVYKGTNLYNRGQLELLSEDFANGTKTLASEGFSQDTSFSFDEFDSTNSSAFTKENINLNFSSTNKSYVVEMDIQNLSPSVNVWAIAEWSVDDNSNVVQGNNVMQKAITSTESKKIYYAISVEDFKSGMQNVSYTMNLKLGNGDYSRSQENLAKINISSDNKVTPKENITGLVVIPEDCKIISAETQSMPNGDSTIDVPISPFAKSGATILVLPSTVESCQTMCVIGCQKVTRITGVETYGSNQMFYGQTGIYSARAKSNGDGVLGSTYAMCSNLEAIDFGDITDIYELSFMSCGLKGELNIPGTIRTIRASAFLNNEKISTIRLQEGVKDIEIDCFDECYSVRNIYFPKTLTSIVNGSPFGTSFNEINRDSNEEVNLYIEDLSNLLGYNYIIASCEKGINLYVNNVLVKDVTIPSTSTKIGEYAFYTMNIESVTIPTSITEIGQQAFEGCLRLKTINYQGTQEQWNAITKGDAWGSSDIEIKYNVQ